MNMTLTPAYGRDYKSKKAVLEDFNSDKDFIINDFTSRWDGKPVNKAQLLEEGVHQVNIRYQRLTKVCVVDVKE
jgi:hypothetical protein